MMATVQWATTMTSMATTMVVDDDYKDVDGDGATGN
jgi:hypothetical protein